MLLYDFRLVSWLLNVFLTLLYGLKKKKKSYVLELVRNSVGFLEHFSIRRNIKFGTDTRVSIGLGHHCTLREERKCTSFKKI